MNSSYRYRLKKWGGATIKLKVVGSVFILFLIFVGFSVYFDRGQESLVTATSTLSKVEDFLLHIRIEESNQGVQVKCSLQYIGEDRTLIEHQLPFVSVSYTNTNHNFKEGNRFISQELGSGGIYYLPTEILPFPEAGDTNIYINATFKANGNQIHIDHNEELSFQ
ncbi:hypothetical protein [Oceanobacillus sp. CF4.6]|uniref:hypothetical protein n=1 Tax=Oceanobacillus sp. CF4.6 TaxID=3373080 RepID=UPI003EE7E53C